MSDRIDYVAECGECKKLAATGREQFPAADLRRLLNRGCSIRKLVDDQPEVSRLLANWCTCKSKKAVTP